MRESKPNRRWLRFSLRTFLFVIGIIAIWLGIISQRAKTQRIAVVAIRNAGGQVAYYNGHDDSGQIFHGERPLGPEWLLKLVGYDYFADIIQVELDNKQITDELVAQLLNLKKLRYLSLRKSRITEQQLAQLSSLSGLEIVDLWSAPITLAGVEKLSKFPVLTQLTLARTPLTDDGLDLLSRITTLKSLLIGATQVSEEGIQRFQKAKPSCEILR